MRNTRDYDVSESVLKKPSFTDELSINNEKILNQLHELEALLNTILSNIFHASGTPECGSEPSTSQIRSVPSVSETILESQHQAISTLDTIIDQAVRLKNLI